MNSTSLCVALASLPPEQYARAVGCSEARYCALYQLYDVATRRWPAPERLPAEQEYVTGRVARVDVALLTGPERQAVAAFARVWREQPTPDAVAEAVRGLAPVWYALLDAERRGLAWWSARGVATSVHASAPRLVAERERFFGVTEGEPPHKGTRDVVTRPLGASRWLSRVVEWSAREPVPSWTLVLHDHAELGASRSREVLRAQAPDLVNEVFARLTQPLD